MGQTTNLNRLAEFLNQKNCRMEGPDIQCFPALWRDVLLPLPTTSIDQNCDVGITKITFWNTQLVTSISSYIVKYHTIRKQAAEKLSINCTPIKHPQLPKQMVLSYVF